MADEAFLYISTTGWKTGRTHEIEIWFVEHDGCYYAVSEYPDKAHWVRNIRHQPKVKWFVGTRAERAAIGDKLPAGTGHAVDRDAEPEIAAAVAGLAPVSGLKSCVQDRLNSTADNNAASAHAPAFHIWISRPHNG